MAKSYWLTHFAATNDSYYLIGLHSKNRREIVGLLSKLFIFFETINDAASEHFRDTFI